MKKIFLPFALFSMAACGSDSEDFNTSNDASIIGKWYIEKVEVFKSKNQQTQTMTSTECKKKSTHEFKSTNMISITFAPQGNNCIQTDVVTRNYTFNTANKKFWYEGEQDYPYYITQLTQTDMVMEDRLEDFDNDGINDVITRFFKRIN